MEINLIIKYKDKFLCEKGMNELGFIKVPHYFQQEDFSNISIFITLLLSNFMNDDKTSKVDGNFAFWDELFGRFFYPDALKQIDEDIYLYSIDVLLKDLLDTCDFDIDEKSSKFPRIFSWIEEKDLINDITLDDEDYSDDDKMYSFSCDKTFFNQRLKETICSLCISHTPKDVLLLYSGGKDSTLSAIRLKQMGYNPYFIHFNNGSMMDVDKPYLTFKKTFQYMDGYNFLFDYSDVNIADLFNLYFLYWANYKGKDKYSYLTSEIRCLSCRMAMYTKALEIAKANNFKVIAEGARICQKFFIEQEKFVSVLKNLMADYGIEMLFPVLYLDDDMALIRELNKNGFSSKSWESKCLLGEKAVDKNKEDEEVIMEYYDNYIRPKILMYLDRK